MVELRNQKFQLLQAEKEPERRVRHVNETEKCEYEQRALHVN